MRSVILTLTFGAVLLTGCHSDTGTGTVVGGGVGVGAGARISPTPTGAAVGGAAGTVTGAAVGASLDSHDRENLDQSCPRTVRKIDRNQQLSLSDIEKMSEAGITDNKIISTIYSTGSIYHLSSSDIEELKNAGVSQRVINYMLETAYE